MKPLSTNDCVAEMSERPGNTQRMSTQTAFTLMAEEHSLISVREVHTGLKEQKGSCLQPFVPFSYLFVSILISSRGRIITTNVNVSGLQTAPG